MDKEESDRRRHQRDLEYLQNLKAEVDVSPGAVTERMIKLGELSDPVRSIKSHDLEGAWPIEATRPDRR